MLDMENDVNSLEENFKHQFSVPNFKKELTLYSEKMQISQVVMFFEKKGYHITKTMIQNYIRQEVLPPVAGKRYYGKYHILIISMIEIMKKRFSFQEIKAFFEIVIPEVFTENSDDYKEVIIKNNEIVFPVYENMYNAYNNSLVSWCEEYVKPMLLSEVSNSELLTEVLMDSIIFGELSQELISKYTK